MGVLILGPNSTGTCNFSDYGTYDALRMVGLRKWHPAFLAFGRRWRYVRQFIASFASDINPNLSQRSGIIGAASYWRIKKKNSPRQQSLWAEWDKPTEEIRKVAEKFVLANCFDPKVASIRFEEKNNW